MSCSCGDSLALLVTLPSVLPWAENTGRRGISRHAPSAAPTLQGREVLHRNQGRTVWDDGKLRVCKKNGSNPELSEEKGTKVSGRSVKKCITSQFTVVRDTVPVSAVQASPAMALRALSLLWSRPAGAAVGCPLVATCPPTLTLGNG